MRIKSCSESLVMNTHVAQLFLSKKVRIMDWVHSAHRLNKKRHEQFVFLQPFFHLVLEVRQRNEISL